MKKMLAVVAAVVVGAGGAALLAPECSSVVLDCRGPGLMHVKAEVCGKAVKVHPALLKEAPAELRNCSSPDGGRVLVLPTDGGAK